MQVLINKQFLKELAVVPLRDRKRIETFVFSDIPTYSNLAEIPGIRKLKGYTQHYRIRLGDCRIGVTYQNETLSLERLLHRKDIYKYFP